MEDASSEDVFTLVTYIAEFAALTNLEMLDVTGCRFNGTFEIKGTQ